MTPKEAVEILKKGNQRFVGNLKMNRNLLQQINETSEGQHPFAVILSCIDSRTSAELIFDQGLGDVFSFRIAGKVQNEDILGSMEFSCKVAGAKVVVVLGHTKCGAVKGACDDVKMGNVTTLLKKLKPAIEAEKSTTNERNSRNVEYVEKVASLNVRITNQQILKNSSILKDMVMKDEIAVIGGMYNVETGVVDFYEDELITSETLKEMEQTVI
ncbi:MAG: carbonic anhydrase family protein [Bacteroidetes bacterium]|nr:carbonic anhydrase family protein [Bacteroidota bacterium]